MFTKKKNLEKQQDSAFVQTLPGLNRRCRKKMNVHITHFFIHKSRVGHYMMWTTQQLKYKRCQHYNLFYKAEEDYLEDNDVHQKVKLPINRERVQRCCCSRVGVLNESRHNNQMFRRILKSQTCKHLWRVCDV